MIADYMCMVIDWAVPSRHDLSADVMMMVWLSAHASYMQNKVCACDGIEA